MPIVERPSYSESTFAFALTWSLAQRHRWRLAGIPYFPWIDEEGMLGWDVSIPLWGRSYFLQFKRSELFDYPKGLRCFRFPVYKPKVSNQHNLLVAWARTERLTYYCAPCFTSFTDLQANVLGGSLSSNTKFVPVRDMPNISVTDSRQHFVTYTATNKGTFRSAPVEIDGIQSADYHFGPDAQGRNARRVEAQRLNQEYFRRLNSSLTELDVDRDVLADDPSSDQYLSMLRARFRAVLGVEWIIALSRSPNDAI